MCPPHAVVPVGGHATDSWGRCANCGAWVWSTEDNGKWEYSNAWVVDSAIADRALLKGDTRAAAQLLVQHDLPYGPVWTTPSALIEMLRAITPSANDRARSEALDAVPPKGRWIDAAKLLRENANKSAPVASELVFELDARFPGRTLGEAYEVGDALVMFQTDPSFEMIRITRATGIGSVSLPGLPTFLARGKDALAFEAGGRIFRLDASGALESMPFDASYTVRPLDDGHWLFDSGGDVRGVQLRRPDMQPLVQIAMRGHAMARRMGEGWILSQCVDDEGHAQALTLFDASFRMVAFSKDVSGARSIAVIDGNALWCETLDAPFTLERWERRDGELVRTLDVPVQTWLRVDGGVIVRPRDPSAPIARFDDDGTRRFSVRRDDWDGATYFQRTKRGLLVYDDSSAEIVGIDDGARGTKWKVESPDVLVASDGTVFVRSQSSLWTIGDGASVRLFVGEHMRLETTCGDAALLRDGRGACLLVGSDGAPRSSFQARDARFSVVGTRGGPYVIEPGRVRISCFPR